MNVQPISRKLGGQEKERETNENEKIGLNSNPS